MNYRTETTQTNPPFLCRYRTVTPSTLEALQAGKLFFSSPCYFNDAFDSVAYINEDQLIRSISMQIENGIKSGYVPKSSFVTLPDDFARLCLKQFYDENRRRVFFDKVKSIARELKSNVSNNTKVICFSEDPLSTLMWGHYTGDNKGFALIFDYESLTNAPVYDANGRKLDEKTILGKMKYHQEMPDRSPLFFDELPFHFFACKRRNVDKSFYKQLLFSKSKSWEYEKEWRLCAIGGDIHHMDPASYVQIEPAAIFLGPRMSDADRNSIFNATKGKNMFFFDVIPDDSSRVQQLIFKEAARPKE